MGANKALVALVAILGVLIVGAMAAIGYGIYAKAADPGFRFFSGEREQAGQIEAPGATVRVALPPGGRVVSVGTTSRYVVVHVAVQGSPETVIVLDPESGAEVRRFTLAPGR